MKTRRLTKVKDLLKALEKANPEARVVYLNNFTVFPIFDIEISDTDVFLKR